MGFKRKSNSEYLGIHEVAGDHVTFIHMETKAARDKQKAGSHWPKDFKIGLHIPGLNKAIEATFGADFGEITVNEFEKKKAYELMKAAEVGTLQFSLEPGERVVFDPAEWDDLI